jgi:hypothetical protein
VIIHYHLNSPLARNFVVLDANTGEDLSGLRITFADDRAGIIRCHVLHPSSQPGNPIVYIGPDARVAVEEVRREIRIAVSPGVTDPERRRMLEALLEVHRDDVDREWPIDRLDHFEGLMIGIVESAIDQGRADMHSIDDVRSLLSEFRRMSGEEMARKIAKDAKARHLQDDDDRRLREFHARRSQDLRENIVFGQRTQPRFDAGGFETQDDL